MSACEILVSKFWVFTQLVGRYDKAGTDKRIHVWWGGAS
jgi:hypothetical protein